MGSKTKTVTSATAAADTATTVGTITIPSGQGGWTVKKILYGFGSVVDAKGATGVLTITADEISGPHSYPLGHGNGGATNSSPVPHGEIEVDIEVPGGTVLTLSVTMADAAVEINVGLTFVQ
jgi:hypothetical protein